MAKKPPVTRVEQKAATRAKVVAAARTMFEVRGYEASTMRDLAAAAGVSTGAVFNCFEDKAALFQAVMGRQAPDVREFLAHLVAHGSAGVAEIAGSLHRDLYGPDAQ